MSKVQAVARVVVGAAVLGAALWGGAAAATTVHVQDHQKATGTVNAVNGTSTPGTCGTAGMPGNFTVASGGNQIGVDVGATTTTFKEHGVSAPSFGNVCAGDTVRALGVLTTNGSLTASTVKVIPPRLQKVSGTVASVNGDATSGTCGTRGMPGAFVVTSPGSSSTVEVGDATTFAERGAGAPSFAMVCVGETVRALGTLADGVLTAAAVTVVPPRPEKVAGTVASVNGTATPGTCGTAGSDGMFAVATSTITVPVDVGATVTNFRERGVSAPSFATVCVGETVRALGALVNGILSATTVTVIPPRPQRASGIVTSVNGTATPGTCGTAGSDGTFAVASKSAPNAVVVGPDTFFTERGVSRPTFGDVCVGGKVRALGTLSPSGDLDATMVTLVPPRPQKVSGSVASVNGSATCGQSGAAGSFVLTSGANQYIVDVGPTNTLFKEHGVSAPSFAIVCSGDKVRTVGSVSPDGTLQASSVVVLVPAG